MARHILKIVFFILLASTSTELLAQKTKMDIITDTAEINRLPNYLKSNTYFINIKIDSATYFYKKDEIERLKYIVKKYKKIIISKTKRIKHMRHLEFTKIGSYYIIAPRISKKSGKTLFMLFFNYETLCFTNYWLGI